MDLEDGPCTDECSSRGEIIDDVNYVKPLEETTPKISIMRRIFQLPFFFWPFVFFQELVFSQYESDIILTSQVSGQRALSVDRSRIIVVETLGVLTVCGEARVECSSGNAKPGE